MKKLLTFIGAIVLAVGAFFAGYFVRPLTDKDYADLNFILTTYKRYYFEEDPNYIDIMGDSLLDDFSEYYTAEEYEIVKKASQGVRAGIGISFGGYVNDFYVSTVLGNSPAEKAGIKKGGKIVGIKTSLDGDFLNLDFNGFSAKMDSVAVNENFFIKIDYNGEQKVFELAKKEYNETYVFYTDESGSYRFNDYDGKLTFNKYENDLGVTIPSDTAYIKYTSFNGLENDLYGSAKQFEKALELFKENGRKKLIIDLRDNGGGFMSIMCEIASHLVGGRTGEKVLVSKAIDKNGKVDKFKSERIDYSKYGFEKIVFLANQGTASASEALIGACLDYDFRNIVRVVLSRSTKDGKTVYKTFGKGIMQTTVENLFGDNAIKLTTAKIYWPTSDVCIHGVGITKNIEEYSDKIIEAEYIENADYELISALSL